MNELELLKQRITKLENELKKLGSSTTIPFNVEQAFRNRITLGELSSSSKAADSEDKTVNEGGVSVYAVLNRPDGYDKRTDAGTTKYYPFYL